MSDHQKKKKKKLKSCNSVSGKLCIKSASVNALIGVHVLLKCIFLLCIKS